MRRKLYVTYANHSHNYLARMMTAEAMSMISSSNRHKLRARPNANWTRFASL